MGQADQITATRTKAARRSAGKPKARETTSVVLTEIHCRLLRRVSAVRGSAGLHAKSESGSDRPYSASEVMRGLIRAATPDLVQELPAPERLAFRTALGI
jgi:hypothetical protein